MIKQFLSLLCAVVLAPAPAVSTGGLQGSWVFQPAPVLYTATCARDDSNTNAYTFNSISTGAHDSARVVAVVGVLAEDSAPAFTVSSVTVDGNATTVYADEGGRGVVDAAFAATTSKITGTASVDVAVNFSETVQAAVVCVWLIENLEDNLPAWGARARGNTTGGALTLRIGDRVLAQQPKDGFTLGVCANAGVTDSATWTGLTKIQDSQTGEFDYSNASVTNNGSNPFDITCDWSGDNNAVGATISFGNIGSAKTVIKYNATCVADTRDQTTYTFNSVSISGLSDATPVVVVVGVVGEDSDTDFDVASATIEGATATIDISNSKTSVLVDAAIIQTSGEIYDASSVDVSITYSEAVTGSAICVWAFENLAFKTPITRNGQALPVAGTATIQLHAVPNGGYGVGVCIEQSQTGSISWSGLTQRDNVTGTEFDYSNAEAATTGGRLSITCTNTAGDIASGTMSFR